MNHEEPAFEGLPESIAGATLVLSEGVLYVGFEPSMIQKVLKGKGRVLRSFADLNTTHGEFDNIFLANRGDPRSVRSMFVTNNQERRGLARGDILPTDLRQVIFPQSGDEMQIRENLLTRTKCPLICVNTQWPADAVRNWLERANEGRPPSRLGIIGIGRIGFEAAKTFLSCSYFAGKNGSDFPISQLGVLDYPSKSLFEAKMLELSHIANGGNTALKRFKTQEDLFNDSDVILFIASDAVPPLTIRDPKQTDVRMVQFQVNFDTLRHYLETAKGTKFTGIFAIVSDPPEHLATAANNEIAQRVSRDPYSNDRLGNHQIPAISGLLNFSRAHAIIREVGDRRLADQFRDEGDVFGPHGRGLVIANAHKNDFDPEFSSRVAQRADVANYEVRKEGKLPYDAPGIDLALGIINMLRGRDEPISIHVGDVSCGIRAMLYPLVGAFQVHGFEDAHPILVERVCGAANLIKSTTDIALQRDPETQIPVRTSAFWANRALTGEALPTRILPTCSGRDITSFRAVVVEKYHFPHEQGEVFISAGHPELKLFVNHAIRYLCADCKISESIPTGGGHREGTHKRNSITEKPLSEKAGIVHIQRLESSRSFDLEKYQQKYPLFLQVDIDIDNPNNMDLVDVLVKNGGIPLGFTPKTFSSSPKLHFGFIGLRVCVDQEMAEIPPLSAMTGYPAAVGVFSDWRNSLAIIRSRIGPDKCAPTWREKRILDGKKTVESTPLFRELLIDLGGYDHTPSLFEHIWDVDETLTHLLGVLNIEDANLDTVRNVCKLHDIGKGIYLLLNHYLNAVRAQNESKTPAGEIVAISPSDLGGENEKWKYGEYYEDLIAGRPIKMLEDIRPYSNFVDVGKGTIEKDVVIAYSIIERSGLLQELDNANTKDALRRFLDAQENIEGADDHTILIELADNLSDYGRMDDIHDVMKYLKYKEDYAISRYGESDEVIASIKRKFTALRNKTMALYKKYRATT